MNGLLKSREYLMKCLGFVLLLGFISLGAIVGCNNNGGGGSSQDTQALTERDFSNNPNLSAKPEEGVVVVFLESTDASEEENLTGEVGFDEIPYRYTRTLNHTFCWEDGDGDAEHFMELVDSEGNEILRIDVNGECVTEVIEAGDYVMIIHHDGKKEKTHPIFIRPEPNGDLGAKKEETIPEGILERAGKFLSTILDKLDISITQTTNAQSVADNVRTLLSTGSCVDCDLSKANLIGRDLSGVDLSGAILKEAKLYQAILTGVIVSQSTDLSLATAPNGGKFPPNSFPDSSGMIDTVIDFPNSNEHQITFTNNCQEPVWIGVIFSSAPALPFLPANNNRTPPLWGPNNMPSWEIPPDGGTRELFLPFGFTSGVIAPRTGCVLDKVCCTDATGTNCAIAANLCTTNDDCKNLAPNTVCATDAALRCKVGTCNDFRNCGQQEKGAEPSTTFEMSLDQAQATTPVTFLNFYNVSMVAGNHIRVQIKPNDMSCPTVGVCNAKPACPWNRVVAADQNRMKTGNLQNFVVANSNESGVCLAPDKFVGNSKFSTITEENPFQNIKVGSDEFRRIGCVASEAPIDTARVCGDPMLQEPPNQFYGCSPFSVKDISRKGLPNGFEFGGCITQFGRDSTGTIRGCTPDNCKIDLLIPFGNNNSDPNIKFKAYSKFQMCDPYGQCDDALGRTAAWPNGEWPEGCTFTGCVPGDAVKTTAYLESVKDQCVTFTGDTNPQRGAYSWQFDDPKLVGTAGALGTCPVMAAVTSKTDFIVTFCGP